MLPHLWVIVRPLCSLLPFFFFQKNSSLQFPRVSDLCTHSLSRASSQWPSLISQLWPLISSFSVLSLSPWKFSPPNHSSTWSSWILPIFFNQNVSAMKNRIDFVYCFLEELWTSRDLVHLGGERVLGGGEFGPQGTVFRVYSWLFT